MRRMVGVACALVLLLVTAGCGGGSSPTPSAGPTGPSEPVDSVAAFQSFSGLTIPASASKVTLQVTSAYDKPAYRVGFDMPSADLDDFCRTGHLDIPLRVVTIPQDYRDTFDYRGDSSTGVAVTTGSLPTNLSVQRKLFALGTKKTTAQVQVYAYQIPS